MDQAFCCSSNCPMVFAAYSSVWIHEVQTVKADVSEFCTVLVQSQELENMVFKICGQK